MLHRRAIVDTAAADDRKLIPTQPTPQGVRLAPDAYLLLYSTHLAEDLRGFIEEHRSPGPFVAALLANDLRAAARTATAFEQHRLPYLISWLEFFAPSGCWGSPQSYRTWLAPQLVHALQLHR